MYSTERKQSVENLFNEAGHDWRDMEESSAVDVSEQGLQVQSEGEWRDVKKLVRKQDSTAWTVTPLGGDYDPLVCTAEHKVKVKYDESVVFREVQYLDPDEEMIRHNGTWKEFAVEETDRVIPVLDFVLAPEHDYDAEGVTSHNTMYGKDYVTPGGHAIKFHSSVRLHLRDAKAKYERRNGQNRQVGATLKPKVEKNRLGPPGRSCEFDLYFNSGIDDLGSIFETLKDYDAIDHSGAGWYRIKDFDGDSQWFQKEDKDEPMKFQKSSFRDRMREDPVFRENALDLLHDNIILEYEEGWVEDKDVFDEDELEELEAEDA